MAEPEHCVKKVQLGDCVCIEKADLHELRLLADQCQQPADGCCVWIRCEKGRVWLECRGSCFTGVPCCFYYEEGEGGARLRCDCRKVDRTNA